MDPNEDRMFRKLRVQDLPYSSGLFRRVTDPAWMDQQCVHRALPERGRFDFGVSSECIIAFQDWPRLQNKLLPSLLLSKPLQGIGRRALC